MPYLHVGGPLDGESFDTFGPQYVPVVAGARDLDPSHPMSRLTAVWSEATIRRVTFSHDRERFTAEVGQPLRQIESKKGDRVNVVQSQIVLRIDASGVITFDRSGPWERTARVDSMDIEAID